jgi:hypothetical protein
MLPTAIHRAMISKPHEKNVVAAGNKFSGYLVRLNKRKKERPHMSLTMGEYLP